MHTVKPDLEVICYSYGISQYVIGDKQNEILKRRGRFAEGNREEEQYGVKGSEEEGRAEEGQGGGLTSDWQIL